MTPAGTPFAAAQEVVKAPCRSSGSAPPTEPMGLVARRARLGTKEIESATLTVGEVAEPLRPR